MRLRVGFVLAAAMLSVVVLGASSASAGRFPASSQSQLNHIKNRVLASQFLSRATFGPTMPEINALANRADQIGAAAAFEEWIDEQFALPVTHHRPLAEQMVIDDYGADGPTMRGIGVFRYRHYAWWHNAITADDQLRQRVAWALSQIFSVGQSGANFNNYRPDYRGNGRWLGMADFYDMLLDNSFGNYRELLGDVTVHPIMGVWLTYVNNRKERRNAEGEIVRAPDENYAREVMQLFTIGIHELTITGELVRQGGRKGTPSETYTNDDIVEFAKVFTGLTYKKDDPNDFFGPLNFTDDMMMVNRYHQDGPKTLLNGTVLPDRNPVDGMADINAALDNLFNHPNSAPFVARRLIQRLVKSNPTKNYIRRVARTFQDNGSGVRGDLKAVVKAVLLDTEAMDSLVMTTGGEGTNLYLDVQSKGTEFSRLREPVLRYTAMIRAFNPTSTYGSGRFMVYSQYANMNQGPYQSPHVFNFYEPDFKPQGEILDYETSANIPNREIVAPEFQILTAVTANRLSNRFLYDTRDRKADFRVRTPAGRVQADVLLDFGPEINLAGRNRQALLRRLDLLLCHGSMHNSSRNLIVQAINQETSNAGVRAEAAILAVLTSPDCAISE